MALLVVQNAKRSGLNLHAVADPAVAAAASGDRFPNTGKEILVIFPNGAGGPIEVTCETTIEVDGQAVADNVVSVADDISTMIGPFPLAEFGDEVLITYDDVTNVFVQVIRIQPGV